MQVAAFEENLASWEARALAELREAEAKVEAQAKVRTSSLAEQRAAACLPARQCPLLTSQPRHTHPSLLQAALGRVVGLLQEAEDLVAKVGATHAKKSAALRGKEASAQSAEKDARAAIAG